MVESPLPYGWSFAHDLDHREQVSLGFKVSELKGLGLNYCIPSFYRAKFIFSKCSSNRTALMVHAICSKKTQALVSGCVLFCANNLYCIFLVLDS